MNEIERPSAATNADSQSTAQAQASPTPGKRDIEYFKEISGRNVSGQTKAIIGLRWFEKNSDGSETEIQEVQMQKPIVYIIKRAGYVNVFLDFQRRNDVDLRNFWDLRTAYFDPSNSVSYTEEELDSGIYNNGPGTPDRLVYFPLLQLMISPIGKESQFIIVGLNPASITLSAPDPTGEPCVVHLIFEESFFVVNDELEKIDLETLYQEEIQLIESGEALNFSEQ